MQEMKIHPYNEAGTPLRGPANYCAVRHMLQRYRLAGCGVARLDARMGAMLTGAQTRSAWSKLANVSSSGFQFNNKKQLLRS